MVDLPIAAACRHLGVRDGFEVLFPRREADGYRLEGHSTGVEEGEAWSARYTILLDARWVTRSAVIIGRSVAGAHEARLEGDGAGDWRVNGVSAPQLAGCLDVDLEASAFTNTLPVHRLGLEAGERAEAPAAYVRVPDLRVQRLEQSYARLDDDGDGTRYDYAAPEFDFTAVLAFDGSGLVLDYPGIAVRVA